MEMMKRDGANISLWQKNTIPYKPHKHGFDKLSSIVFDVAIVGGGITGLTTALQLQKAGKHCILLEAYNLCFGTSGGTTAHLNTILDTPYYQIIKNFGEDAAIKVAQSALNAVELIKRNIKEYNIECAYEDATGYIYSENEKQDEELVKLHESIKKVGLPVTFTDEVPLNLPHRKAIAFTGQGKFHPVDYLYSLAAAFEAKGGVILENCLVTSHESKDGIATVITNVADIKAKNVLYATHIPPGVNVLHFRCAPYRSYAVALKLASGIYPKDLVYDMYDPYHYYRSQVVDGETYLIAGGEDHKTGHNTDTIECFKKLEEYFRSKLDIASIDYRWSSQYFEPADGLPYIGHLPGNADNIYVATGFGGNGITYGTVSALVIVDLITNRKSEYEEIYSPSRIKAIAGFENMMKEGFDVAKMFVAPNAGEDLKEIEKIKSGEGGIVKLNGKTLAVHRNFEGNLYVLNATCPHIGCQVKWNNTEKTWDCPCHGSRFSITGQVLTGPTQKGLQQEDLK